VSPHKESADDEVQVQGIRDQESDEEVNAGVDQGGSWEMESGSDGNCDRHKI